MIRSDGYSRCQKPVWPCLKQTRARLCVSNAKSLFQLLSPLLDLRETERRMVKAEIEKCEARNIDTLKSPPLNRNNGRRPLEPMAGSRTRHVSPLQGSRPRRSSSDRHKTNDKSVSLKVNHPLPDPQHHYKSSHNTNQHKHEPSSYITLT